MTPLPDSPVGTEILERTCMMCDEVRRVIAKVGPLEIKEPCPNVCKGGYFQPPGRVIKNPGKESNRGEYQR